MEEDPIGFSSQKRLPPSHGSPFKKSAFHSPARSPSTSLQIKLPLNDEAEDEFSFMKRFRSGSKLFSEAVANDLFGSGYGRWSSAGEFLLERSRTFQRFLALMIGINIRAYFK